MQVPPQRRDYTADSCSPHLFGPRRLASPCLAFSSLALARLAYLRLDAKAFGFLSFLLFTLCSPAAVGCLSLSEDVRPSLAIFCDRLVYIDGRRQREQLDVVRSNRVRVVLAEYSPRERNVDVGGAADHLDIAYDALASRWIVDGMAAHRAPAIDVASCPDGEDTCKGRRLMVVGHG
jgi:hypothetical protein